MIDAIISGIGLGLLLSVLIGPVFFLLIKTSIYDGFKSAMFLEIGICLSDLLCICLSYLGLVNFLKDDEFRLIVNIVGGIILIFFGIYTYRHKTKLQNKLTIPKRDDYIKLILKGFVFNISNPSVIFFWIGVVGIAVSQFEGKCLPIAIYFASTLVVVILIDILKAKLAQRLSEYLNEQRLGWLSKSSGFIIALFGVGLLTKTLMSW